MAVPRRRERANKWQRECHSRCFAGRCPDNPSHQLHPLPKSHLSPSPSQVSNDTSHSYPPSLFPSHRVLPSPCQLSRTWLPPEEELSGDRRATSSTPTVVQPSLYAGWDQARMEAPTKPPLQARQGLGSAEERLCQPCVPPTRLK